MKKKILVFAVAFAMVFAMAACGGGSSDSEETAMAEKTAVNVFAAASLSAVMADFEASYEEANPEVDIVVNAHVTFSSALHRNRWMSLKAQAWWSKVQEQMSSTTSS